MKYIDRLLMLFLVLGIWTLVLKPESISAHSGQYCDIESGTGYGEADDDGNVYVYQIEGQVFCH